MSYKNSKNASFNKFNQDQFVSIKLFRLLESYKHKKFIVIEPGGNFGDRLIYLGAEKMLKALNIDYMICSFHAFDERDFKDEKRVVYIHGGGPLECWGNIHLRILLKCVQLGYEEIILGPQSCSSDVNYLKRIYRDFESNSNIRNKRIYLFARDPVSYSLLKQYLPASINLDLDHDTAFNLCEKDLKSNKREDYILYALREDEEKNNSINYPTYGLRVDPAVFGRSFDEWVDIHARATTVITNRLHSSILSSILSKQTFLFANSYHKNRSIWEYSLSDRNVQWLDNKKSLNRFLFFIYSNLLGVTIFGYRYIRYFWKIIYLKQSKKMDRYVFILKRSIKLLLFRGSTKGAYENH
jgi:exopolysaccharide biosynthesis predicted pyruvyltransferase EpsI